jgi:hypothetical protein
MWQVEVLVWQRVEGALREGEQARLGKAIRGATRKWLLRHSPDSVQLGVWLRSLLRDGEQEFKPSSVTAKAAEG